MIEERTDYGLLHFCATCERQHKLAPHPVNGGWVCAVVCNCRDRLGLPLRYATESAVLPTFELAEAFRTHLLSTRVAA